MLIDDSDSDKAHEPVSLPQALVYLSLSPFFVVLCLVTLVLHSVYAILDILGLYRFNITRQNKLYSRFEARYV